MPVPQPSPSNPCSGREGAALSPFPSRAVAPSPLTRKPPPRSHARTRSRSRPWCVLRPPRYFPYPLIVNEINFLFLYAPFPHFKLTLPSLLSPFPSRLSSLSLFLASYPSTLPFSSPSHFSLLSLHLVYPTLPLPSLLFIPPSMREKMPEQSNDYRVVVFGAGGVGKSSLVLRFVKGTFRESYIPTIEDTYRQVISCNKNICTLQITDTTGSHQFPAMQRLSISKGHAFILVYSITSRQSLEELRPIWEVIREIKGNEMEFPIMLVGNKCDESDAREVQSSYGEAQAKAWKCNFMETSAKTNHNVKELFQELLNMEKNRNMSLQLDGKKNKSQKGTRKIKEKCLVM
ncbi:putative GTP-binding protein Di-Ras2 [Penaeus vannamei]|uniref:Putative GTP-binding protein Di-Ras2 n=2 Tax=Penaeus TaxID=133894 RepID=A0A3R7SJ28_PENVA|nr:putative GTP-binding protein Di-Ras2 [Penaeus vannamei]